MLDCLPPELLRYITIYTDAGDVCNLMASSASLYVHLSNFPISQATVRGFEMFDFVMWLERHGITKVHHLTIYDYNMRNDHCMYSYTENCTCIEDITRILESLEIEFLTLRDCRIDDTDMLEIKWSDHIRKLHLTNYNFDSNMKWLFYTLPEIRELRINYQYSEYEAFFMPNLMFLETGIQNPKLESFSTNMFFFGEDLEVMLRNSCKNENLKVFSLCDISASSVDVEILNLVKELYPNCKLHIMS
jgi:hypothetical protein